MKKKIRMWIALGMIALMCLFMAACGGPQKSTLYVLSYKPEYQEFFDYVKEIYLKENADIKDVEYVTVDTNDYNTVLNSRIQSKYLDVFATQVTYMMQGQSNYMLELEKKDYFDNFEERYLELGQYYDPASDKEPQQLTMPMEFVGSVVFYNKTIFAEYGLTPPATWSEFINICREFQEIAGAPVTGKTRIEAPIIFGGKSEWPAMNILNAIVPDTVELQKPDFFSNIKNYDADPSIRFNTPAWLESFEKLQTIAGFISENLYGLDYSYAPAYFSTGVPSTGKMYPMMIDGTWSYSQINGSFEVGAFILPAAENTVNGDGKKNFATKAGMSMSVFNGSNKPEAAQRFIELLFRDDVYKKFLEVSCTPSMLKSVTSENALMNSLFDESKYTFTEMYDSRMPRYMPLPSGAELISLMKKGTTPGQVADNLQKQVEANKVDWEKYVNLSHTKP